MAGLVSAMKIGLFGINFGLAGGVDAMVRIAKAAEEAGLESVWTGEHVVMPVRDNPVPTPPETPFLDSIVSLTHVASVTNFGSGGLRFLSPVAVGSRVHLRQRLKSVEAHRRGTLLTSEVAIHVVGEERPALLYDLQLLYFPASGASAP